MRVALEDLGISISIPDILAGVAWRETHITYRRHNLEKSVPSRLYAVNSNEGRHSGAPRNFVMRGG